MNDIMARITTPSASREWRSGAKRRRRTTRCCIRKIMKDVVVRRISENARFISTEIFVNVPSIKNIPQD